MIKPLKISFQSAEHIPPPFCNEVNLETVLTDTGLQTSFDIRYTHREEMDLEEIQTEGFTGQDDFAWKGVLDKIWDKEINKILSDTKPSEGESDFDNIIHIESDSFVGMPVNQEDWEYLLQELTQAVFETAKRELPLKVVYREIDTQKNAKEISITLYFANRKAILDYASNTKTLSWQDAQAFVNLIFTAEFIPEMATEKIPVKTGQFLNIGDGLWYRFNDAVRNPTGNKSILKRISENFIK
jgi:hypothetical protein